MLLAERAYNTLVVSSSAKFDDAIAPLLTSAQCAPVTFVNNIAAAKRAVLDSRYDFVIVNTPLPDEFGTRFAVELSTTGRSTVCLLFVSADRCEEVRARTLRHGVFVLPKPTATPLIAHGLRFMAATRERLKRFEEKTISIEEKMEEIRIVNRAKWVLIENLQMSEPDAHRYIEKQAMDTCTTRREVAEGIIRTYN